MKNKKVLFLLIIAFAVMVSGCLASKQTHMPYDEALAGYTPQTAYAFFGDNHYFHQVEEVRLETEDNILKIVLNGEVLNNEIGESSKDYHFEQQIEIIEDRYWLTNDGETLNESDYDRICILQTPIAIGNTWEFKAVRDHNIKVKVTAEIVDVTSDEVTVAYRDDKEYRERRVLKKGYGITEFYKVYQFEEASAITGFSIDLAYDDHQTPEEDDVELLYDATSRIKIPSDINALMLAYNVAWEEYVNDGNPAVFDYVEPSSMAFEKIQKVTGEDTDIDFISFKPLEYDEDLNENMADITLMEAFYSNDQMFLNHVKYHLIKLDSKWMISDFEAILQE